MKNTFSNIAAIIKFSDNDIRVIHDKFVKFPKKYMTDLSSDDVMHELVKFSNNPSIAEEFDIKLTLQILANIEARSTDIKEKNYTNGNILFTISFEDDINENFRYCINDIKCFRKYTDMNFFVNKETARIHWESFCSRVSIKKSLDIDSNN